MARGGVAHGDAVDRIVQEWRRERPDLDVTSSAVIIRIAILAHRYHVALARFFASQGMTRADFEVLATLRRCGHPYALPQHDITRASQRSSGTISFRIDRLEQEGLVKRLPDPEDARSVIVALTDRGRRKVDTVAPAHLANQRLLLGALSEREQHDLAGLLRKLMLDEA